MADGTKQKVVDKALEMVKKAYNEGIYVQITEGYRSNQRQTELYNQGRTKPGEIVTNAKAGQSNHNYGIAIDFVLVSKDGQRTLWNVNSDWRRVAEIGKSLGFEWGGDWSSFKDYPHLQMTELKGNQTSKGGRKMSLKVDGSLGPKTIKRLQEFMGTTQDGVISEPTSTVIKELQKFLNNYGQ